jgi:hypothetical protein
MAESVDDRGAVPTEDRQPRHRPSFGLGFTVGVVAALGVVAVCVVVLAAVLSTTLDRLASPGPRVEVTPVKTAKDWFSVKTDGNGTLQGWSTGNFGSTDDGDFGPVDHVGYVDVGMLGRVGDVNTLQSVKVYMMRDTQVVVGRQQYAKGKFGSAAEAILDMDGNGADLLMNRLLTIEFRSVGPHVVASRVAAPLETGASPLEY